MSPSLPSSAKFPSKERKERGHLARIVHKAGGMPALPSRSRGAFTLLEMLVATAVFAMLMMVVLQMTSGLMSGATRMDENLKMEQDVRLFFDILRRDLAQARIGTKQNQFYSTNTSIAFVSSSQRLKPNYVSDQRLVSYFLADAKTNNGITSYSIRRAVVDPTINNYPTNWNPLVTNWWTSSGLTNTNFQEVVLSNVVEVSGVQGVFFYYEAGKTNVYLGLDPTNPPRGLKVNFNLLTKRATKTGVTNVGGIKQFEYDVDLNIPPVFNP